MVGDLLRRDQFAQSFNLPLSEALARDIGPADCQPPLHLRKTSKKTSKIFTKKTPESTPKTQKNMFFFYMYLKMYIIGRFSSPCHNSGCLVVWAVGLSPPPASPSVKKLATNAKDFESSSVMHIYGTAVRRHCTDWYEI